MQCINCSLETDNPKFCSMSCAAKHNNKIHPKRPKSKNVCKGCGLPKLSRNKVTYCKSCRPNYGQDMTLAEAKYLKHGMQNTYSLIRQRARHSMRHITSCTECGYSKHVEVAHIKPVSSFTDDTLISVINHPSNLKVLCPNCHWEFDHQK